MPDKFLPHLTPIKNRLFCDQKSASVRRPQTKRNGTLRSGSCTFKITTTATKLAGLRGLTNWYIAECLLARHCVTNATVIMFYTWNFPTFKRYIFLRLEGYYLKLDCAKLYEVVTRYFYFPKISRQQSS